MRHFCSLIIIFKVTFSIESGWKDGKCGPCFCQQDNDKYGKAEQTVNCSSLDLTLIPQNLPTTIHVLDLSGNKLRNTQNLVGLKRYGDRLFYLSLANNEISQLDPSIFSFVRDLEELDLSGNILNSVDAEDFKKLNLLKLIGMHAKTYRNRFVGLEVLSITYGNNVISKDIFDKLQVFQLSVSFTTAKRLPSSIFKFGSNTLTTLSIIAPSLLELPGDIFKGLSVLKTLYIDGESIRWVPDTLFFKPSVENMPIHLYSLTLKGIHSVPRDLLKNQQSLRLAKLQYIMDMPPLNLPSQLDSLDFRDSNVFSVPPKTYLKLSNLRQLVLSNASLSTLEEMSFYGLSSLSFLDLSKNKLSSLPNGLFLSCIHSLEVLDLSHNIISNVAKSYFSSVSSLQVLDLGFNMIETIDNNAFENLNMLTNLKLTENSITLLPETLFKNVFSLKTINLNQNKISKIPGNIFKHSRHLLNVNLEDNPLFCDCNITQIKQIGKYVEITGLCSGPSAYKGISVSNFEQDPKTCAKNLDAVTTKNPVEEEATSCFNSTVPMKENTNNECRENETLVFLLYISLTIILITVIVSTFMLIRRMLWRLRQRGDYVLPPPKRVPFSFSFNKES